MSKYKVMAARIASLRSIRVSIIWISTMISTLNRSTPPYKKDKAGENPKCNPEMENNSIPVRNMAQPVFQGVKSYLLYMANEAKIMNITVVAINASITRACPVKVRANSAHGHATKILSLMVKMTSNGIFAGRRREVGDVALVVAIKATNDEGIHPQKTIS